MSFTTSARLSRSQYTLAVSGGTGNLGQAIVRTLLKSYKPFFSSIIVITRSGSSTPAQALASEGALVREVALSSNLSDDQKKQLRSALGTVNVLIDALGPGTKSVKREVFKAALDEGVGVYFPSEYGVDHRLNYQLFPGYDHPEWVFKREWIAEARQLALQQNARTKIVAVYCVLFLETIGHPIWSSPMISDDVPVAWTSKTDVGRAVAELALLSLSPATSQTVPPEVRVRGCHATASDIKGLAVAAGANLTDGMNAGEKSVEDVKARLRKESGSDQAKRPADHVRVLMAEGLLNWSGPNDTQNELVNPGVWKWKTPQDVLVERA